MSMTTAFKHVSYLWDESRAAALAGNEVDLFIYRSNLLGADLRLTNYAGGNTSVKIQETDPLTGESVAVMWVKGSGGDIGTLTKAGCANLYVDKLHTLKRRYRGLEFEDEMVELFNHCLFDPKCATPSIDTPLHGLLPFKHIDHLHPDALIALAASKDGEAIMKEIWGDTMTWIPWQRPGFDLGLQLEAALKGNPNLRGLILGGHGLFTWGDTSYASYVNTLEVIEAASLYLEKITAKPVLFLVAPNFKLLHPPSVLKKPLPSCQPCVAWRPATAAWWAILRTIHGCWSSSIPMIWRSWLLWAPVAPTTFCAPKFVPWCWTYPPQGPT